MVTGGCRYGDYREAGRLGPPSPSVQGAPHVGVQEVIPLEQQWFVTLDGQGVGEAVAEVQSGRVA